MVSGARSKAEDGPVSVDVLVARCLGILALRHSQKDVEDEKECILFLSSLGFGTKDIAAMLQAVEKTVMNRVGEYRNANAKVKRRGKN